MSSKWTSKLISKAAKLRKDSDDSSTTNGMNDFLYGVGGAPPPQVDLPPAQPAIPRAAQPKLDLEDNDNGLGEPLPPPNPAYALPPLTKGKGIHVGFTEERPVIIGEGGDEAELPTNQVSSHAGQLSPTKARDATRPTSNGHDNSELHLGPGDAPVPSVTVARAPTRKANTGPGFLQKRASFNFEEGKIQRQASSTDLASVVARQPFGASLDPNALQQQPPIDSAPPPLSAMERLKARHSPMQNLLDAVHHKHGHDPPKRSPDKLWDALLKHPDVSKPRTSAPSSPEPPMSLPPTQMKTDLNGASTRQNRDPAMTQNLGPTSNQNAPEDAFHGEFRRGPSPSRPPMQMPPRQAERVSRDQELQAAQQAEMVPASPESSEYTPYSPVSQAIHDMMGSTQNISLNDNWKAPEAHQPTGYAPTRPPPPGQAQGQGSQQLQPGLAQREELGSGISNTAPMRPAGRRPTDVALNSQPPPSAGLEPPRLGHRKPSLPHQVLAPEYPSHNIPPQGAPPSAPPPIQPPVPTERTDLFDRRPSDVPPARPGFAAHGPPSGPPQAALPRPPSDQPPPDREPTLPILPPHPNGDALERHGSHTSSLDARSLGSNLQPVRSRGGSVEPQQISRPSSSRSAVSPAQELFADAVSGLRYGAVSPNIPSPVQVHGPGRVQPPQQSPPGSVPPTVYQPSTGTTDNFRACIDALQSCFVHAEGDARALIGNRTAQWLRLASWWNLKGRKAFEFRIKEFNQNVAARSEGIDESLKQPFIDVAKAWWIVERIIPQVLRDPRSNFTQPSEGLEGPALQQVYHTLKVQVETFISSVSRRHLLPAPELLNINFASFFVQYPQLPTVIRTLTAGYSDRKDEEKPTDAPFFGIVLADTPRHFSYGHLFAETQVTLPHVGDDDEDDDLVLPCVISLIRDKTMSQMEMVVSTQDGQINLRVRADGRGLPTWNEVELRPRSHSIRIELMSEFNIIIRLEKEDFKTLWGIREYNKQVMDEWSPAKDERLIYETRLYDFNYIPPKGVPHPLPSNPIKDCAMRLYEKTDPPNQDGKLIHRGHRMVVITSPDVKTLNNVSMRFDANFPILHSLLRGEQGYPALLLHIIQHDQPHRVIPAFRDAEDRNRFCEKLSGSYLANDEVNIGTMKVTNISVSTAVPGTPGNLLDLPGVQWTDIHILSKMENGTDPRHTDCFRITADSSVGRLVDRPVIRGGELKVGLDALDLNSIKLRRSQDSSLVVALIENKLPSGMTAALQDAFKKKSTAASTIRYQFPSMADMHEFEEIVTGYRVLYDGITSHFSIKGQLKAAGLAKRMEATRTRIQIVQEEKKNTLQLLAFFKDMPDGACMSFGLSATDHYEASHSSGKFYLRFVDARFGVPKPLSEPDATFVSLDMPEFAGERDDINVGFDTEEERERLVEALPAAPSKASGLASFKHSLSNKFVELQKTGGRPVSRQSQQ